MSKAPITATPHVFYIRPAPGWLDVVHDEVNFLIQTPLHKYKFEAKVTLLKSTVKLHRCDWRQGLEVLLRMTTAHDVEWLILESKCTKWSEVEAILKRVPWESVLPNRNIPVHVTSEVYDGFTTDSASLREKLCAFAGVTHVSEGGEIRFKIELRDEFLRILVSLAGEPLYKRGYKAKLIATAPLPEHQAAACARWVLQGKKSDSPISTVYVPFAGSGTFGFEALLVLSQSGVGAFPRSYACDSFPATPQTTMDFFRRKLKEKLDTAVLPHLLFNDFNAQAISVLKENVAAFPNSKDIEILEGDVFDLKPQLHKDGSTLVLLNPPYGDRLANHSEIPALYGKLGTLMRTLSIENKNVLGGVICPDEYTWKAFLNSLQFQNPETHHFTHGGKQMRLVRWSTQ